MMSKTYPKYKSSGVEWLGDVLEHWGIWKLAHGFDLVGSGTTPPSDKLEWYEGTIPWITTSELRENLIITTEKTVTKEAVHRFSALKVFPKGSLAIAMYGATIGRLGILGIEATTNQACCVMHGGHVFAIHFVYYWMQAFKDSIILLASGGGQPNISQDKIKSIKIPCPKISEQQAIASFLDRETGRIDSLIAKKQRLLQLLAEQRTALISRAVTKGLDASVKLKPSGVEWLGDVPEHWGVKKLKYQSTINDETLPETTDPDYELLYVDISSVDPSKGIVQKEQLLFENAPSRARRIVRKGDTIVSTVRTYLRAIAPVIDPESNLIVSTGFAVIRPRKVSHDYLSAVIRAPYFIEEVVSRSVGVSYPAINASEIGFISIPLPTLPEQQAIATFLDSETAKIDTLSARVITVIEQLKEYRTALISSAVTGKIDVREAV